MMNPITKIEDARLLAQAIVNTIPEPFVVLDERFHVLSASRSFYETFKVKPEQTQGRLLYALGDGQWDIPALRLLLETIIPERTAMDDFEVEHDFPGLGHRVMLLNARKVLYENSPSITILLAFRDITARREIERQKEVLQTQTDVLLHDKGVLIQEMQHRVANSLQIIASILLLKARSVTSEETRQHLRDAHQRVLSVAVVQSLLHATDGVDQIDVAEYLPMLCDSLASSMIGEGNPIKLKVIAGPSMIESSTCVSLGLIVTELVINALKYAFPLKKAGSMVLVTYEHKAADWKLIVSDNGVGMSNDHVADKSEALGTTIVKALAKQLKAQMDVVSSADGLSVSITRASFTSHMPKAA